MKKNAIALTGILFAMFTVSCAKYNVNNETKPANQDQKPRAVDLSGKSLTEVLALKYNRAELKCELWTQLSQKLDISVIPNDFISLDLKKEAMPESLSLKGEVANHKVSVNVKINSAEVIEGLSSEVESGEKYTWQFSPLIEASIFHESVTTKSTGSIVINTKDPKSLIKEKIKNVQVQDSLKAEPEQQGGGTIDHGFYHDYAHCYIDTEIKPEYQDQFKVEIKKP